MKYSNNDVTVPISHPFFLEINPPTPPPLKAPIAEATKANGITAACGMSNDEAKTANSNNTIKQTSTPINVPIKIGFANCFKKTERPLALPT